MGHFSSSVLYFIVVLLPSFDHSYITNLFFRTFKIHFYLNLTYQESNSKIVNFGLSTPNPCKAPWNKKVRRPLVVQCLPEWHTAKNPPETMRKLCLSTKFPHHEIRWNYGIFRSGTQSLILYQYHHY